MTLKKKNKCKKRTKRSKKIEIHEVVSIEPGHISVGSTYKGYLDYPAQECTSQSCCGMQQTFCAEFTSGSYFAKEQIPLRAWSYNDFFRID